LLISALNFDENLAILCTKQLCVYVYVRGFIYVWVLVLSMRVQHK